MMGTLIIWDLDGTLTESKPCIVASYQYAAKAAGLPVPSEESLSGMMCGGLRDHIYEVFGKTGPEADRIVEYYRDYSRRHSDDIQLFDGILDVVRELSSRGVAQAIATMKLKNMAEDIAERLGLSEYMVAVEGDVPDGKITKCQMIKNCMATGTYDRVIMIGDCPSDQKAAAEAGVEFIAAVYGYGYTRARCQAEGTAFVENASEAISLACR